MIDANAPLSAGPKILDPQPWALYSSWNGVILNRYELEWPGFIFDPRPEYSQDRQDYI